MARFNGWHHLDVNTFPFTQLHLVKKPNGSYIVLVPRQVSSQHTTATIKILINLGYDKVKQSL